MILIATNYSYIHNLKFILLQMENGEEVELEEFYVKYKNL